ncbi:MAG: class I SAM-dependent methyltransferase [Bacteroidales bacterium]|jgi:Predicted O-methyltransferase|nr:class I SAM-dependent methyltransferase [Bacteroidales bacterium]HNT41592.1 class I SAM-dependent methyltransferase [Tenuifilaceae bacterium]MBP8642788.1 class I SAM-dependent methyltransferase [Bacteroidales bacterium]NLI87014.1 class I SAM-dependent methyltransferase [Bacteroidales bacterium]HOA08865.1 class I SAM-dependent methyltransferase [Tenuifilaceae bacterium]
MRTGFIGQLLNYLRFRVNCKRRGGYGIHSPYVYSLYTETLNADSKNNKVFERIEQYRKDLRRCGLSIVRQRLGDNPENGFPGDKVKLARIARNVSVPPHLGRLLFRLCSRFNPEIIVELGTSVGISTMYMAAANPNSKVYTIEGEESILAIARNRFKQMGFTNIEPIAGNFDVQLPELIKRISTIDFAFIDGDHNGRALLQNFNRMLPRVADTSVFVIDDIRWSPGMEAAWKQICSNPKVTISIDLFRCGILFFRTGIAKQHFLLRYGPY